MNTILYENVWDYPRPPRLEKTQDLIVIAFGGNLVQSQENFRILETSHPPTYYIPMKAFQEGSLKPVRGTTFCEWKGAASYYTLFRIG